MPVKAGSFTPTGTGNISVANLTFLPNEIVFRVGNATAADDTAQIARNDSWTTDTNQSYDSWYIKLGNTPIAGKSVRGTDKCIRYIRDVSGTVTDVIVATFVSFDTNVPGTNYGFTLNFTVTNSNYQVRYIARG